MKNIFRNTCVKYSLYFLNLLFALVGVGIILFGTKIYADGNRYIAFLPEDIFKWGIFLIVSGSFVFLISIVGYAGEISGKQYILSAFGLMLVAVIILEFGIMIYIQVKHETLDVDIHTNLNHTFMQSVNDEKYLTSYHNVQEDFKCCGVSTPNDWKIIKSDLPSSCCQNSTDPCLINYAYPVGCSLTVTNVFHRFFVLLTIIGIILCSLHIIGIVLICCLHSEYRIQSALQKEVIARQDARMERAIMFIMSEH